MCGVHVSAPRPGCDETRATFASHTHTPLNPITPQPCRLWSRAATPTLIGAKRNFKPSISLFLSLSITLSHPLSNCFSLSLSLSLSSSLSLTHTHTHTHTHTQSLSLSLSLSL